MMRRREFRGQPPVEPPAPGSTKGQDVTDPSWLPVAPDEAMTFGQEGHAQHSVRTLSGGLDLLHDVLTEVFEPREEDAREHKRKPHVVCVQIVPATHVRMGSFGVSANGTRVVTGKDDRLRVLLSNRGPDPVYVSHSTLTGDVTTSPGAVMLAAGAAPLPLYEKDDDLYAYVAAGKSATLDVVDEFGYA